VPHYPTIEGMRLVDYKVRILPPSRDGDGTDAVTRVMIESADQSGLTWRTVGISPNIIDASIEALADALVWKLIKDGVSAPGA
jgi:2-isopropylmalate synthase